MTRRKSRSRLLRTWKPANLNEWIAALFVVFIATALLVQALRALIGVIFGHWYIAAGLGFGLAIAIAVALWWQVAAVRGRSARLRHLRLTLHELDGMSPQAFEFAVRDLMLRDGMNARHVGRRGDKAADVVALDDRGHRIVVQCKHTTTGSKVGAGVVYQVNGTAGPAHGADVAVIVTNGAFTSGARENAAEFRIHLIGRQGLARWAADGESLQRLLRLTTPLRRRRRLRHLAFTRHRSPSLREADSQEVT
ncbi:restriction endonuclease [Microbispora bryophytorum]|uniref:restriction endonuclease n=1 Tax=Microbispora bryophytorum TaxID=1460882 RepID=UPI0037171467